MLAPNGLISSESTRGSRRGRTKDGHGGVEGERWGRVTPLTRRVSGGKQAEKGEKKRSIY